MWQNWHCKAAKHSILPLSEFESIMKKSSDIRLNQMMNKQIVSNLYKLFDELFGDLQDANANYLSLQTKESNIWMLLGLMRLHLSFPARFFDPNLKFKIRLDDAEASLAQLFEEIELRKRVELFHSGKSTNYFIKQLQQKYDLLLKHRSTLLSKVTFRTESDLTFSDFWHEVTNFIQNQFDCDELIQLFAKYTNGSDQNYVFQQIQSRLQTSFNFVQRLHDNYRHFNDFVSPIIDSIELIRYGLSFCTLSCNASSSIITNAIKQLLSPISQSMDNCQNLMHSDLHHLIQKNCEFANNDERIKKSKLHRLDGKKLSSKLLISGLQQSINFVDNTGSAQFLSRKEMESFDQWFSLLTHLYHEQEENRRWEQQEKQVLEFILIVRRRVFD